MILSGTISAFGQAVLGSNTVVLTGLNAIIPIQHHLKVSLAQQVQLY
jgi:hypothetical protein